MQRHIITPRADWQAQAEKYGFSFHSRGGPYWNEHACYSFTPHEIDQLETAANDVHELSLYAVQHVIDNNLFARLAIPEHAAKLARQSWDQDELHLYGRFDFAFDGTTPKMLEYNADTPTSLLESAIVQWDWLNQTRSGKDQFNSLHERLVERWKQLGIRTPLYVAGQQETDDTAAYEEDRITTAYMEDAARQAGLDTEYLDIEDIGYNARAGEFRDLSERRIETLFKLYPWEKMAKDNFGKHLPSGMRTIEPAWKMILSNKGILPILWEIAPGHPNLLPAYRTAHQLGQSWVRKPLFSREGQNVTIQLPEMQETSDGIYGEEGHIFQAYSELPVFDGKRPVLGIWMVGDECTGMGIRETATRITNNRSEFVPHYIE